MSDAFLLSAIVFLPTVGAALLMLFDRKAEEAMRNFSLVITLATFIFTLFLLGKFDPSVAGIQMPVKMEWIKTWNVNYQLGIDGISLTLVLLTSLISLLGMLASWSVKG